MSLDEFSSSLAPAICELILQKRANGSKYIHGETLLRHFDRFCVEVGYADSVLTEDIVLRWKDHNKNRKHRQQSQYLSYVRHLGQYLHSIGVPTYIPPTEQYSGTADPIELSSPFAPHIENFILQKQADGYDYTLGERTLYRFDRHCVELGITEPVLTRDLALEWIMLTTKRNAPLMREFAKYLLSIGNEAYVIQKLPVRHYQQPYILADDELTAFFAAVDSFNPDYRSCDQMAAGYSVMFRLHYCCGMRSQEVCCLKVDDVDLSTGKIIILNSKGHKDRVIYMHQDLLHICKNYDTLVRKTLPQRRWFFPAKEPSKTINKANMTRRFHYFWKMTPYSNNSARAPTVHSLRHTFVVNRINSWIQEGRDLSHMMPYLSRYLGHSTEEDTHYYYHLAASATNIIRDRDLQSQKVIPEVIPYEEM